MALCLYCYCVHTVNEIAVGEAAVIVDCCVVSVLTVVSVMCCQVAEDPDVVLGPQRNGCRVEIVGGVAHTTSFQVCSLLCLSTFALHN